MTFQDKKQDYYTLRNEEVTRAAYLSSDVTAVSFAGRSNRLSFVYDPTTVDLTTTTYRGQEFAGVGVIEDSAFAPGVINFADALKVAQGMFNLKEGSWYEQPEVTRDLKTSKSTRKEADRLSDIVILSL